MLTLLYFTACQKDFLVKYPSEQISQESIEDLVNQDPRILDGYMNGIYAKMYEAGSGGTTGHDDFGQKAYDVFTDMLVGDMVLAGDNYGWYVNIANLTAPTNYTVNQVYMPWRYYYSIIYMANSVIRDLGGNDFTPEEEVRKHLLGQAKAIRAHSYFYLANFYAQEGYGTGSEKIIPVYSEVQDANNPKATSKEVYDLIIKDLRDAVILLETFNRGAVKHAINQHVAKGLLAYALAARATTEDLQEVVTLTDEVIQNSGARITSSMEVAARLNANGALENPESGFNNVATASWLWGVDLTLDSKLDLVSWWGQIDYFTYSYANAGDGKTIDDLLYGAIRSGDIRENQFDADLWPTGKFFAPERIAGGQRNILTDYVYMRLDEMVLLHAEAQAKLGNSNAAITALKSLLAQRFANPSDYSYVNNLTGQALLDEIYLQTRIELWGEGKAYLALKRNKETIHRGNNHLFHIGASFTFNDERISFPIPQAEVLNNPNLNK